MPEFVRVYMREVVPLREAGKPGCDAVRMQRGTVLLCKKEAVRILVKIFFFCRVRGLSFFPFLQELHSLRRNAYPARGLCRFRAVLVNAYISGIQNIIADMEAVVSGIDSGPFQTENFTAARSGY